MRTPATGRFVALGDSITNGWKATVEAAKWVTLLGGKLNTLFGGFSFTAVNSGIAGNRSFDLLARVKKDTTSFQPLVVTVMCGTNDIRDNRSVDTFIAEMGQVIDEIKNNCRWAQIYLASPPFMTSYNLGGAAVHATYNTRIQQLATDKGINFVDIFTATNGHLEWLDADGFHPIDAGHQAICDTFYSSISAKVKITPAARKNSPR